MKTLEEEKAEYTRRIEMREAFERAKDTVDEIEIEALERDSEVVDHLESSNPSWNYNEYSYRIKIEPREFYMELFFDGGEAVYNSKEEAVFCPPRGEIIKVREVLDE